VRWFAGGILIVAGLCWAAFSGGCTVNIVMAKPSTYPSLDGVAIVVTAASALLGLGVAAVGVAALRNRKR
jgi:hypothetical protein